MGEHFDGGVGELGEGVELGCSVFMRWGLKCVEGDCERR